MFSTNCSACAHSPTDDQQTSLADIVIFMLCSHQILDKRGPNSRLPYSMQLNRSISSTGIMPRHIWRPIARVGWV